MGGKLLRDMVVLLPGITGSVLQKDGKDVWAISGQAAGRLLASRDDWRRQLALGGADHNGIVATRVMPDAHVVPGLVKIDGYSAMAQMVAGAFDTRPGSIWDERPANFIEFPYDWRLDNRINAGLLKSLISKRLPQWQEYSGNKNARVIFLAHSMGGLVARYYLEVLEGWPNCKALITFGTPYRGSVNALNFLANGYKKLFVDLTEVMRSFPAMYQLLPIYKALLVDGEYTRVAEADEITGVGREQAADALKFHREIEAKVNEHQAEPGYRDHGYVIVPVVGTRQPTMQSAVLTDGHLTVGPEPPAGIDPLLADGDGTVPRASAIPIELSDAYRDSFTPERHGALQCNRAILNDLRGRLEQMQARGLREVRGPQEDPVAEETAAVALDLDDLYLPDEQVILRARLINAERSVGPLLARIEPVDAPAGDPVAAREFTEADDGWSLELTGLGPGLYRTEVRTAQAGPGAPPPVHDLFEIAGRAEHAG